MRSVPQSAELLSSHDVEPTGTNTEELSPCGYDKGERTIRGPGQCPKTEWWASGRKHLPQKSPTTFLSRIRYVTTLSMFTNPDKGVKREKFAD